MNFKQRFKNKYQTSNNAYGNQPVAGLEKTLKYVSGNETLELGIGSGRNAIHLIEKKLKVTGVDSSKEGLDILRKKVKSDNLTLINQDVLSYKFNKKFDLILSVGLMHFLKPSDSKILFERIQKNTKPNGINFVVVKMSQNIIGDLPNVFITNQLKNIYLSQQWKILNYVEIQNRNKKIARIIAKKATN